MSAERLYAQLAGSQQQMQIEAARFFANPTRHNLQLYIAAIDVLGHSANHLLRASADEELLALSPAATQRQLPSPDGGSSSLRSIKNDR